jgi:alkanesulfonate monooxygenase SsuD/methylene tetrahydromethanopterin reductase-like flavin-dependent oxidoreductase (luciferase family)
MRAEEQGFDFVSASDHPSSGHPTLETWTLLSWIAANTTRIGVATRVLGVPNRPPPVVAKMAETLDRLSGGRLILGLGGGYADDEFRAFGLRVPTAREKVDGLEEAIRITHGLWSEPFFTFDGVHYRTEMAELEPKPSRRIPIWLGTLGPRALRLTGRLADGWIPSLDLAPPERVPMLHEQILRGAHEAGRDPGDITLAYNMEIRIDERGEKGSHVVTGTADAIAEQLIGFTELGFTAMNFQPQGPARDEQIQRLASEVIPAVREAV